MKVRKLRVCGDPAAGDALITWIFSKFLALRIFSGCLLMTRPLVTTQKKSYLSSTDEVKRSLLFLAD